MIGKYAFEAFSLVKKRGCPKAAPVISVVTDQYSGSSKP